MTYSILDRKQSYLRLLCLCLGIYLYSSGLYASPINLDLVIELRGFPPQETIGDQNFVFSDVCKAFGVFLTQGNGILGSGPFQSVRCDDGTTEKNASKDLNWHLRIHGDSSNKTFEIYRFNADGGEKNYVTYSLPTEIGPLTLMNKKDTNALIAFYLTEGLPFRSVIKVQKSTDHTVTLTGKKYSFNSDLEPEDLSLFTVNEIDHDFDINPIVPMHIVKSSTEDIQWQSDPIDEKHKVREGDLLFVQQVSNRENLLNEIDERVKSDSDLFFNSFLNIGRSVYMGGRYGFPIKGNDILKNAPSIGIFGEFKLGPLQGIKGTYDFIPKQRYVSETGVTEFEWSRLQFGYAFERALSNKLLNLIDFVPRLGVTNIKYNFYANDSDSNSYEFRLFRSPTIGAEAGIENRNNFFRLRLWAYGSYSVGILPLDKLYKTNSVRVGVDIYREFLSFRTMKLASLIFTSSDRTSISRKNADEEAASHQTYVPELVFNSFYVGGGLTLTW
jgi:hypothetical protein